jgi:general secretion pathway protein J
MPGSRGFSLLELLVAMAVLALLASISFRGLSSILDADARVQAELRRWGDVGRVMEQLGRDLSLAVERPVQEAAGELVIRRRGEGDGGAAQSGVQQVGYRLRAGTLEYLAWPAGPAPGAAPAASIVLEDISALELRALGPDGNWSPLRGAAGVAPRAVAAEIVLAGGERVWRLFLLP